MINNVKIKIFLSIFLAFLISSFISNVFFLDKSPQLKGNLLGNFTSFLRSTGKQLSQIQPPSFQNTSSLSLQNPLLSQQNNNSVSSNLPPSSEAGIYVQQTSTSSYILVNEKEVQWKLYTYQVDGTKITIKASLNDTPPSAENINYLFKN